MTTETNKEASEAAIKIAKMTGMAKDMGYDVTSRNSIYEFLYRIYRDNQEELSNTLSQFDNLAEAILIAGTSAQKIGFDPVDILYEEDTDDPEPSPEEIELIIHYVWKTGGHPKNKEDIRKYVQSHMESKFLKFQEKIIESVYNHYIDNKTRIDAYINKLEKFNKILKGEKY